jgi:hypothetical protein
VAVVIHDDHALRGLFEELVRRQFYRADLYDSDIVAYVGGVLASFTHTDRLYQIRNAQGRRLEDVAEMLIESNPLLDATSFHREREVRKHIGDFTLFFAGFYPEAIASLPRVHPLSVDTFVDYVAAGKESYAVVAAFNLFEFRDEAPLFRRLSERFDECAHGLRLVKRELDHAQARPDGSLDPSRH